MGEPFEIRSAHPSDRAAVVGLWLELIEYHRRLDPDYPVPAGLREALLAEIDRGLERPACRLLLAAGAGEAIGFLFAEADAESRRGEEEVGSGWIHELWVAPAWRRRGVASALVEEAQCFFDERGEARMSVRVEAGNAEGLAFWRRRGFRERARILERSADA